MILYLVVRSLSFLLPRIPVSVSYAMSGFLADLVFLFWREKRSYMLENMAQVLGTDAAPGTIRRVARQSLRNYGKYLVDFVRFPSLKGEEIQRLITFEGWENVDAALLGGKGAIFIGLHMGNWDLGAAAAALRDYPVNVVAETFSHAGVNAFVQGVRAKTGMRIIPMEDAARRILRALHRNELLGLLIDRPSPEDGVAVRFFDRATRVPAGAAALALRTGAPVVPAVAVRRKDNTFLGIVERTIDFHPTGDLHRDVQELTQRIMTSLEGIVRQYPEQWYMFRRMWVPESELPKNT